MNNDRKPDIVFGRFGWDFLKIYFNNGGNKFSGPITVQLRGYFVDLKSKDINGDEQPDIIVINHRGLDIFYTDCSARSIP